MDYPSTKCNMSDSYEYYNVHEISTANINIAYSNITNCFLHNTTINACNIYNSTLINCTVSNSYIGNDVTFINCPPGSDPESAIALSDYLGEQLENDYEIIEDNYNMFFTDAESIYQHMKYYQTPESEYPSESDLMLYMAEKSNISISMLYPVDNETGNFDYFINFIDDYTATLNGNYIFINNINIEVFMTYRIQMNSNNGCSLTSFNGEFKYNQNNTSYWNNTITESFYKINSNNWNYEAELCNSSTVVSGSNSSSYATETFNIDFIIDNIRIDYSDNFQYAPNNYLPNYNYYGKTITICSENINYTWGKHTGSIDGDNSKEIYPIKENNSNGFLINQEYYFSSTYAWFQPNITAGTNESINLCKNGSIFDPTYERISKTYYKKWRVKIGFKADFWYHLSKKEYANVYIVVAAGLTATGIIGGIIGFFGGLPGLILCIILAILLAILGYKADQLLDDMKDPVDEDLDMKEHVSGYYATGGIGTAYYYRYDKGDATTKLTPSYYIGPADMHKLSRY